jgi:hypothetical protein
MITVSLRFRSVIANANAFERQHNGQFNVINYYKSIKVIYDTYPEVFSMIKNVLIVEQDGITFKDH